MEKYKSEHAQGLVEYAIIILLVALVVILVVTLFGISVGDLFSTVNNAIPN